MTAATRDAELEDLRAQVRQLRGALEQRESDLAKLRTVLSSYEAELRALHGHADADRVALCGARDPFSPRVCRLMAGHSGEHQDLFFSPPQLNARAGESTEHAPESTPAEEREP